MISTLKVSPIAANIRLASSRVTTSRRKGEFFVDDLEHRLLDLAQVLVGEAAAGLVEVVVEAVVDRRTDGDLRAGEEPLHGVGHDVRGRVADDGEPVGVRRADGRELRGRRLDRRVKVDRAPAVAHRDDVLVELAGRGEDLARGLAISHGKGAVL